MRMRALITHRGVAYFDLDRLVMVQPDSADAQRCIAHFDGLSSRMGPIPVSVHMNADDLAELAGRA